MKKLSCLVLALASTASIATSSLACSSCHCLIGNRPGAMTATLGGGYFAPGSQRHLNTRGAGMVALGYDFTANWGIEGLLAFFSTNFKRSSSDFLIDGNRRSVNGTLFSINGVYHLLPQFPIQPYVLAGVGILGLKHNGTDTNNSGNFNAAIGAQYFINKIFSVRVEARDLYTWVSSRNDWFFSAGVSATFDFC